MDWRELSDADEPPPPGRAGWTWEDQAGPPELYRLLEVGTRASVEEIRRAYRRLVASAHPDHRVAAEQGLAQRQTALLNHAYATLREPARREAYDRRHGLV